MNLPPCLLKIEHLTPQVCINERPFLLQSPVGALAPRKLRGNLHNRESVAARVL